MAINILSNAKGLEPYEYRLMLRSPNGLMINPIMGVFDFESNMRLETVSNITFKVAKYITSYQHKTIENPLWDYLEEPFLISVNDEITYRIDEATLSVDTNGGTVKEITALSLENEMSSKLVQNFKSTINDEANPQYIEDLMNDFLSEKLDNLWSIGNIDADVQTRLRLVPDTDEKTLYEFFKEVQTAYNCIFKYDSSIVENENNQRRPSRKIHIYDNTVYKVCPNCGSDIYYQDNYQHCKNPNCGIDGINKKDGYRWEKAIYGLDSGLIITDTNYIKSYSEKFEKPVTRLYVKGADDLDIILANPTGQDYIDDFSYYTGSDYDNTKFMSPELLKALKRYNILLESLSEQIEPLREKVNQLTIRKSNLLYGNIESIAEDLAMVEGWLDRANEYFNDWYSNKNEDALDNANDLLDTVDDWFDGKKVIVDNVSKKRTDWYYYDDAGNIQTYGIENLQRLYNVYDERISIIGQLNDKLEYTEEDGEYLLQNTLDDNNLDTRNLDTRFDGIDVSNLTKIRNQISTAITNLNDILSTVESDITNTKDELSDLREKISKQCAEDDDGIIFTEDLIKELNLFIIEGTYTNDTIGTSADIGSEEYINACEELYKDGLIAMKEKHEPLMSVDADIIDLLSCCDCAIDSARIGIGNVVRVQHSEGSDKKNNYANMIFRIVEYTHSPTSNSLKLTLSNTEHFKSDRSSIAELLKNASSTSSVVSSTKGSWNRAEQNAVDTIINDGLNTAKTTIQCADHQRSVMDNRGLTMGSYVESESDKQVRLMNTGLYITDNDWNTINTAITGEGIIADRLMGTMFIGKACQFIAKHLEDDGTTTNVFAKFDENGFRIGNTRFSVGNIDPKTGEIDFDNNGFFVDPNKGIVVRGTSNGNVCEVRLNPNVSRTIEVVTVNSSGTTTKEHLYFDKDSGKFVVNGNIYAKSLYLSELEDKSIADVIESKTASNKPSGDQVNKIKGDYIEGRGLKAYDSNGDIRVEIDGSDGSLKMYEGYIEMTDSNGNKLTIEPETFIKWIINNEPKFYYDGNNNSLVFGGNINTKEDVIIGETLHMCNYNNQGYIKFGDYASISGNKNTDTLKLSAMHGIELESSSGAVTIDGVDVKSKINKLISEVADLTIKVNALMAS